MALKTEYFYYQSKNNVTGITDVTANIVRNGTSVATGVAMSQVNSTTQPGVYVLALSPSTLSSYGGSGYYEVYINSATLLLSASAIAAKWILSINDEDLDAHLTLQDTAIATVQTGVTANNTLLVNGTYGLSAIRTLVAAVQSAVASIQNNTNFTAAVPDQSIRPDTSSTTFRIPLGLFNNQGMQEDPDGNSILVSIQNSSGTSRSAYLVGYNSGTDNAPAVRDSVGNYHIDYLIPSTATLEEIIFTFSYSENSNAFIQRRVSEVVSNVQITGYALQTTSLSILSQTTDIQTKVNDATYGLAAIQTLLNSVSTLSTNTYNLLTDATNGLAAIKTAVNSRSSQASVDTANAALLAIEGTGFNTVSDSLAALSTRIFSGGHAV